MSSARLQQFRSMAFSSVRIVITIVIGFWGLCAVAGIGLLHSEGGLTTTTAVLGTMLLVFASLCFGTLYGVLNARRWSMYAVASLAIMVFAANLVLWASAE